MSTQPQQFGQPIGNIVNSAMRAQMASVFGGTSFLNDSKTVARATVSRRVLPEGEYSFELESATEAMSKNNNPKIVYSFKLFVEDETKPGTYTTVDFQHHQHMCAIDGSEPNELGYYLLVRLMYLRGMLVANAEGGLVFAQGALEADGAPNLSLLTGCTGTLRLGVREEQYTDQRSGELRTSPKNAFYGIV